MPAAVAAARSTLSTPMPKREMIRQRFICPIISPVILAYVTRRASAPAAIFRICSGVGCEASCRSAPIADSTSRAGSRFGKTESATATNRGGIARDYITWRLEHSEYSRARCVTATGTTHVCARGPHENTAFSRDHDPDVFARFRAVDEGPTECGPAHARWQAESCGAGAASGRWEAGPFGNLERAVGICAEPRKRPQGGGPIPAMG